MSNFRNSSWTHFSQCADQVEEQQWGNASVLPLPDLHFALHLVGLLGNPATDLLEAHQRMEWSNWKEEWRGMWCRWWCSYSGGAAVVDIWSLLWGLSWAGSSAASVLFISSFLLGWCFRSGPKSTPKAKGFDPSPQIVCNSMSFLGVLVFSSIHIDRGRYRMFFWRPDVR